MHLSMLPLCSFLFITTSIPSLLAAPTSNAEPIAQELSVRQTTQPPGPLDQYWNGDMSLTNAFLNSVNYTGPSSWDVEFCAYDNTSPAFQWAILLPSQPPGGCGGGFLDNFRGRCGVISNWGCTFVGAEETTAMLYFATSVFCTAYDITAAIGAASYGGIPNMDCQPADKEDGGDVGFDLPFAGDGK